MPGCTVLFWFVLERSRFQQIYTMPEDAETKKLLVNCHFSGMFLHALLFIPFICSIVTTSWVQFNGVEYGLWKQCYYFNETQSSEADTNWTVVKEPCRDHELKLPALFHLARALFALAMVVYILAIVLKVNLTCAPDDDEIIRNALKVQAVIFVFMYAGLWMFKLHKDNYDKKYSLNSKYGGSAWVALIVSHLHLVTMLLTASPALVRGYRRCKKGRCPSSSDNTVTTTTRATTASPMATTELGATSTTTRMTMKTTSTSTDLSMMEMPHPPPYSQDLPPSYTYVPGNSTNNGRRGSPDDIFTVLVNPRNYNEGHTSPNHDNNNDTGSLADRNSDTDGPSSRPCSRDIFTVVVNPAPPPTDSPARPTEEDTTDDTSTRPPPPQYDQLSTELGPQPEDRIQTSPPPAYEDIIEGTATDV